MRKSRADDPERRARQARWARYKIRQDSYVELFAKQDGACAICLSRSDKLQVDHDHETGKVRGLLCGKCNRALGLLKDSTESVMRALKYLEKNAQHVARRESLMDIKNLFEQKQERKTEWVKIPGTEIEVFVKHLLPLDLDRIGKQRNLYKKVGGKRDPQLYLEAVMVETVRDWKGIEFDGNPWPCTPDNVRELNRLFSPFRDVWFKASGLASTVEEEEDEESELGN